MQGEGGGSKGHLKRCENYSHAHSLCWYKNKENKNQESKKKKKAKKKKKEEKNKKEKKKSGVVYLAAR